MSGFGSPGGRAINIKPTPPEKGSFPLDHDAECKHLIGSYLACIKSNRGVNDDACRLLAKGYLACRMDHNLMARDEWKNLGLPDPNSETMAKGDEAAGFKSKANAGGQIPAGK